MVLNIHISSQGYQLSHYITLIIFCSIHEWCIACLCARELGEFAYTEEPKLIICCVNTTLQL